MKKLAAALLGAVMLLQTGAFAKEISSENFDSSALDNAWSVDSGIAVSYDEGSDYSESKCYKIAVESGSETSVAKYSDMEYDSSKLFQIGFDAMMTGRIKVVPYGYTSSGGVTTTVNCEWGSGNTENGITVQPGVWYSYRFDIDLSAGSWKLYVDNELFKEGTTSVVKNANLMMYIYDADIYMDNFYMDGSAGLQKFSASDNVKIFGTEEIVAKPEEIEKNQALKASYIGDSGTRGQMARYYSEQNSGNVTIEYSYLVESAAEAADGIEVIFYGGGVTANIQGDGYLSFNGKTTYVGFGKWVDVKMLLNMTDFTYDAYINDTLVAEECKFGGSIANMVLWLNPGNVIYLDNVKIGDAIFDSFEGENGWSSVYGAEMELVDITKSSNKSVVFTNSNESYKFATRQLGTEGSEVVELEFDMKPVDISTTAYVRFGNKDGDVFDTAWVKGLIYGTSSTMNYSSGWNHFKFIFDTVADKYYVYNGGTLASEGDYTNPIPTKVHIILNNSAMAVDNVNVNATGGVYVNDMKLVDAAGNTVIKASEKGVKGSAVIENTSKVNEVEYMMLTAVYSEGRLVGVEMTVGTVAAEESKSVETELVKVNGDCVKIFVWDSEKNPLTDNYTV